MQLFILSVPSKVMEPKVMERGSDHIKVSWKPPLEKNGNLTGYLIQYKKGEKC